MNKNLLLSILIWIACVQTSTAQETTYSLVENISYIGDKNASEYAQKRCKIDIYYREIKTNYTMVVWFHEGGITDTGSFAKEITVPGK
ncbi:MAG TPA: hypothetical protein VEP89_17085 [Draconibacterium sp.]|nr:hypothetical protein [Draconibacterium sp.]